MIEKIAALIHVIWANWTTYFFQVGKIQPDGSLLIPADKVARWKRQIQTEYADLPAGEQESDLDLAVRILETVSGPEDRLGLTRKPDSTFRVAKCEHGAKDGERMISLGGDRLLALCPMCWALVEARVLTNVIERAAFSALVNGSLSPDKGKQE